MNAEDKRAQRLKLQEDHIGRALQDSEKSGELKAAPSYGKPLGFGDRVHSGCHLDRGGNCDTAAGDRGCGWPFGRLVAPQRIGESDNIRLIRNGKRRPRGDAA